VKALAKWRYHLRIGLRQRKVVFNTVDYWLREDQGLGITQFMDKQPIARAFTSFASFTLLAAVCGPLAAAQDSPREQDNPSSPPAFRINEISQGPSEYATGEPRVASNVAVASASVVAISPDAAVTPHPLDKAIAIANNSLNKMRTEVDDYTGLFVRRECVNGVKGEPGYMQLKIRCPRENQSGRVPFSIYMKFLKPRQSAGRECIWVDGQHDSKIVAHEARGLIGMKRFYLEPTGMIAMSESRYPIYEAGIENLIKKLIEKAERDRAVGPCEVNIRENCQVNGRKCLVIEVCHPEKRPPYDFHKAHVFIDNETELPIAYAAYGWPSMPGGPTPLIEEYHYLNLKVNVGLTAKDFCADNPSYSFPRR
jgi:hypothetical protein